MTQVKLMRVQKVQAELMSEQQTINRKGMKRHEKQNTTHENRTTKNVPHMRIECTQLA